MKVTLVVTVFNEIGSIESFLDSVLKQTKLPDEFTIVDGGSTDGTVNAIKSFQKKYKWLKLMVVKNASRGKGRNIAIKNAKNELIAVTDGGCVLDKNWLKNIVEPFKEGYEVVIGYYKPFYQTDFQFFCGYLMVPKKINETVRISSRSLAFKKHVWKETGGYEENVDVGEDTLFHFRIHEGNYKTMLQSNAFVYWQMPKNSKELFTKFLKYGAGHWQTVKLKGFRKFMILILGSYAYFLSIIGSLLTLNTNFLFFLISLFLIASVYVGIKGSISTNNPKSLIYLPYLFFLKNFAYVAGFTFKKAVYRRWRLMKSKV